jgi:phosphatidylglycerol lysyltransferase
LRFLYENIDRFYNFKGLHAFKEKFHPAWSPRYLAIPGVGNLPVISLSLLRASFRTNVIPFLPSKK